MRWLVALCCFAVTSVGAQQPTPQAPESAQTESTRTPPPPTPDQRRFLDGLRTASRGIAQMRGGLARVSRAQTSDDSASEHTAGRFLAGLCGSARAFLRRGRPRMDPTVYSDSTRLSARRLVTQLDSLIAYAPTCEASAAATPGPIAADLGKRMKSYEAALRDFRLAIGQWVDTAKVRKP